MKEKLFQLKAFSKEVLHLPKPIAKTFWSLSLFWSMATTFPLINVLFQCKPKIADFSKHILSNASLNNLDIAGRTGLYYKAIAAVIFLTFFYYLLISYISKNASNASKEMISTLNNLAVIGVFTLLGGLIFSWVDSAAYLLMVFTGVLVFEIRKNNFNQEVNRTLWPVFMAIPPALMGYMYLRVNEFFTIIKPQFTHKGQVLAVDPYLLGFIVLLGLFTVVFHYVGLLYKTKKNLFSASSFFMSSLIIQSLLLELTNVINVRFGIVFNHPFLLFSATMAVTLLLFLFRLKSNKEEKATCFSNRFLPILLLGLLLILAQPWRMYNPQNEFFETANHGISIDHFFRYGSIPMIETFDAHMMSQQVFGYLYGLLNGYEPWSPFLYVYYYYVLEAFIIFYVLRKILGPVTSFFIVLCIPFLGAIQNEFAMAGLLALSLASLLRTPNRKTLIWFWASIFLLCLYKLDVGFAATASALVIYGSFLWLKKDVSGAKKMVKSGLIFLTTVFLLFSFLCVLKGINPIMRGKEFLYLSLSNQSWGVLKMGDMNHILFRLSYYLLPAITLILFVKVAYKTVRLKIQNQPIPAKQFYPLVFFTFFVLFFIFNAPRGIVRHNFEYLNILRILSTIPFALLMIVIYYKGKKKGLVYLLGTMLSMYIVLGAVKTDFLRRGNSHFTQAIASGAFYEGFLPATNFNGTRLRSAVTNESEIQAFKKLLDAVLKPTETYYDFSSFNYYHALVGRKNPSYVNQTPLMINGDKEQEIEINLIKEQKIPLILMPIKNNPWHAIDEVYVDFKYYKMSEYIYQHYVPLHRMASFDIYVLKERAAEIKTKLQSNRSSGENLINTDFSFLTDASIQNNNLQIAINPDKSATLKSPGSNAFFIGLMQYLGKTGKLPVNPGSGKMRFKINAVTQGNIKLYYKIKPEESFSEAQAKEYPLVVGTNVLDLSLQSLPAELMFAVNTSEITLQELAFTNGSQTDLLRPERIDYNTGFIPMLWAEKGDVESFTKVPVLKEVIEGNTAKIASKNLNQRSGGAFAFLEIESPEYCNGKIELVSENSSKAAYSFSIDGGKHQYAIRISNGYYWWNTLNPLVTFSSDKNVKITKFSLLSEDGSVIENVKEEPLTLANLNDENWTNGCSSKYKLLSIAFTTKNEKLVKENKNIKTVTGKLVPITGYYVSGGYINITVNADIASISNEIGYPNVIQFVK